MTVPLSVLDLASVYDGMSNADALADTIETARVAESLGYKRFWVAEHHGMPAVSSSAPAVLIGAIAAATSSIRVGSGGVMLPNHSSLVVAEQFATLVALYGDRVDLGLGRAPGTDGLTSALLRRGTGLESVDDFPHQVMELSAWFGTTPPLENGVGMRVVAVPGVGYAPEMWLLGSSDFSARLAGFLGLPFAFAYHFAGTDTPELPFEAYRASFTPSSVLAQPHSMIAVGVVVADDAEAAERLARPQALSMLRMRQGHRPERIPSLEQADAHPWTAPEIDWVSARSRLQAIGDRAHVRSRIDELVARTEADEVIVVPQGPDLHARLRTLRELKP
jgi:luciferase family oxidoreductase group 1